MLGFLGVLLFLLVALVSESSAEPPAPSVHWGAIAYPDQWRLLETGVTLNRFTEFNASMRRYNAIQESAGFNFATLTWTEYWPRFSGWSTNVTLGAGPTRDQPTNAIQNQGIHRWLGFARVPVHATREAADLMLDASATRWASLFGYPRIVFVGGGVALGTLYEEMFVRAGVRRLPIAELAGVTGTDRWSRLARSIRVSAMGRYSRMWPGAAYDQVKPMSSLAQVSVSIGDYEANPFRPRWEFEFAYTIDSGLFVTPSGNAIEEQFGAVSLRLAFLTLETWNDSIHRRHDFGPTYGARVMIDLFRLYDR